MRAMVVWHQKQGSAAKARLILLALLAWLPRDAVADTYLTIPIASYHFDRDEDYNEFNLGVGIERTLNDRWRIGGGYFRNSNRKDSLFAGATYAPWSFAGLKIGTAMGLVTGYEASVLPVVVPTAMWESGSFGVNVAFIPPAGGKPGALGFQLKWRWD